jgi:hypothetical protein
MLKLSFLESMADQDIAEIVSWAGNPPDEVTQAVISQCGGSPYLAQYLMHHLWPENHPGQVMPMTRKFCQEQYAELQVWADDIGNAGLHAYQVLAERLQLLRQGENEMTVRGTAVPGGGQPRATVPYPTP